MDRNGSPDQCRKVFKVDIMGMFAKLISTFTDSNGTKNKFLLTGTESSDFETDMIVEQGTDGDWTYRKWSSGFYECWGRFTETQIDIDAPWGNGYCVKLGSVDNFPITFRSVPFVNITVQVTNGNGNGAYKNNTSTTNVGTIYIISSASATNVTAVTNVYAVGKWR